MIGVVRGMPSRRVNVKTATYVVSADVVTGANNTTATVTVTWADKVAEQSFGATAGNLISITLETVL